MLIAFCVSAIFLLAGFVQGMTGFGSALVAMPLLSLCVDVKIAVPLCSLNSVVITTFLVLRLKRHMAWGRIAPLCLASIPGLLVGVGLLKQVSSRSLSVTLGVLLLLYSIYSLVNRVKPHSLHRYWAYVAGFFSGAIGAAFSAGGPPAIIYATLHDWEKDEIKATLSGFFLFNSYLISSTHALTGVTTMEVLSLFRYSAPFVFVGTILGALYYGRVNKSLYLKVIFVFLAGMGAMMIVVG